jgi:hypothetical protein
MSVSEQARRPGTQIDSRLAWGFLAGAAAIGVGAAAGRSLALGFGVLMFVVVSYVVLRHPFAGVVALVGLMPIVSGMRRGLVVPYLRPSEALVVWLAPLVLFAARGSVPRWGTLEWLGLAYAGGTLLLGSFDLWRRGAPFDKSNVEGLLGPCQYLLLLRAVRVGTATERDWRRAVAALIAAAVPVSIFALLQGFGVAWARHLGATLTGVVSNHPDRASGPFTNWQVLAGYLLAVGLVTAAVLAFGAWRILRPRVAAVILVLIAAALARTLTIGAFAGWAVGAAALAVSAGRVRVSAARVAGAAVAAVLALTLVLAARFQQEFHAAVGQAGTGVIPRTLVNRYDIWTQQYFPALSDRWVTGFGPDIPSNATWKFTDSVYVTMVLRGGLILLALYAALMAGFVAVARRISGGDAEARALGAALVVLVIALVPLQLIATYFTTSGLPELLWITAALVSVLPFLKGRART